jgi:hypothetical protein
MVSLKYPKKGYYICDNSIAASATDRRPYRKDYR